MVPRVLDHHGSLAVAVETAVWCLEATVGVFLDHDEESFQDI
jgi:hypothetical protein